jgi:hypothetical protein
VQDEILNISDLKSKKLKVNRFWQNIQLVVALRQLKDNQAI